MKQEKENKAAEYARMVGKTVSTVAGKTKSTIEKAGQAAVTVLDATGDGTVGIDDLIILGMNTPGVRIDREKFLRSELQKSYPKSIIDDAVQRTPALAGLPREMTDRIADDVIQNERIKVSGISAVLGAPGGAAMAATIPADIIQYYGYTLRAAQKLLYLYGFPQIDTSENELALDTGTMNTLILCLGVMYGVGGANKALLAMTQALGRGVERKLMNTAVTKGAIYPIVKKTAQWFGVRMTKDVFAGFFKKAIPVVGGLVGGGLTYAAFKPCCEKLKNTLKDTILSNPDAHKNDEAIIIEAEEVKNAEEI